MNRFVMVFDSVLTNKVLEDPVCYILFTRFLLLAQRGDYRHRDDRGHEVQLHAGQCVVAISTMKRWTRCGQSRILQALQVLESEGMIQREYPTHMGTLLTLKNFSKWNNSGVAYSQPTRSVPPGVGEQEELYKQERKESGVRVAPHTPGFVPPDKVAVASYAEQYRDKRHHNVNNDLLMEWCRLFFDTYTGQGWKKGNGQKITDWTAVLRTWIDGNYKRLNQPRKQ